MRVLIACEYSGTVRDAFIARGHDAISCDLLPTDKPGPHHQGSVLDILDDGFDLMIAHPPCTYLCLSGARWFYDDRYPNRMHDFQQAVDFFKALQTADIDKICIENSQPMGRTIQQVGRYTQVVQPWWWGELFTKGAYLWLQNLRKLVGTVYEKPDNVVATCHNEAPGPERGKKRSVTYQSIANAMAEQWG